MGVWRDDLLRSKPVLEEIREENMKVQGFVLLAFAVTLTALSCGKGSSETERTPKSIAKSEVLRQFRLDYKGNKRFYELFASGFISYCAYLFLGTQIPQSLNKRVLLAFCWITVTLRW